MGLRKKAKESKRPLVSVSVLNFNGKHLLQDCLSSLLAQSYKRVEVILVDNGSTDGSAEWVAKRFGKRVRIVRFPTNRSISEGINAGLKASKGELLLSLNNDTKAERSAIAELVKAAQAHPQAGCLQPKLVYFNDPTKINAAGISVDESGYAANFGDGKDASLPEFNRVHEIFAPAGAAFMVRKKVLAQVGDFDSDYGAYIEDVEFGWRAHLAGWKSLFVPKAVIRHIGSATFGKGEKATYFGHRNRILFALSSFPPKLLAKFLLYFLVFDVPLMLYWLITDRTRVRARLDGFKLLPLAMRKRSRIKLLQKISDGEVAALLKPAYGVRVLKEKLGLK